MDDKAPQGNSTSTNCRYCGSYENSIENESVRNQPAVFQVVVACASCGRAFAAISRN